jgi:hypothetical protein
MTGSGVRIGGRLLRRFLPPGERGDSIRGDLIEECTRPSCRLTCAGGKVTVEEHWTAPAGGAMLAVSRTIAGGRLAEFEFLRILEHGGGLVYIAQPNGRPPTEFAMTRSDGHSVTFENPQHDFPKMIRYEKRADGTIVASIAGAGGARGISWVFSRMASG